ncbi:MAG: hypothetical protein NVS9B14_10990 [Candidatus Acidiferrum sp.]
MGTREQMVLLISDDEGFCARTREELQLRQGALRVATVNTLEGARRAVEHETPAVIVIEEATLRTGGESDARPRPDTVVSALASFAPVVVLGSEPRPAELDALVAAGAAEYLSGSNRSCTAMDLVERKLKQARTVKEQVQSAKMEAAQEKWPQPLDDFGQLLRHELNNPLTGILGNAELLLSEVRRKNDGKLPNGGQLRLETIAALAVRLRETVRRLSQEWESQRAQATNSK